MHDKDYAGCAGMCGCYELGWADWIDIVGLCNLDYAGWQLCGTAAPGLRETPTALDCAGLHEMVVA